MQNTTSPATSPETTMHIMMFPWLAYGHISPFVQLAHKIIAVAGSSIRVTFLITKGNVPRVMTLLPCTPLISILPLDLPHVPGLPPGAENTAEVTEEGAELLKIALDKTKPQVEDILMRTRPDIVIMDFVQAWLPSLAKPLGIKTLFFSVFPASALTYFFATSRQLHGPNPTLQDIMKAPAGFPASSLIQSIPAFKAANHLNVFNTSFGQPSVFNRFMKSIEDCDGTIAKTCMEMEGKYIEFYKSEHRKMLLVGPVVPETPAGVLEKRWAEWLAEFPEKSVVYCSFGSEAVLTDEAVEELLLGLESTGFPFLAVLKFPSGEEKEEVEDILNRKLPKGFKERVKGRGIVHCGWVQQQHILQHKNVGCFVSHVGFSSLMEGMIADCQLVMLPQRADQLTNSVLLEKELGVGVEVERNEADGSFRREAISDAIKAVMVEEESRGKNWKEFLMNKEVQEKFMVEFVKSLRDLVAAPGN
ncbi:anthocyanidin 3-O-glucosyltransferase-like protein [Carex littledalei]|uniref:Anthocyanidin 3-O-glucosyltransferase-like protein n=1 Tax=Carex littledalei TaxID=544730 RepID=A0A833VGE3_9POAL|nr:anthocyanidin 3-O-glucosyltransferase-like protein [Carex littledalei]